MIQPLHPPASLHLLAAQGWFELGNHLEADKELDEITPGLRAHPGVLEVRWQIYAAAKKCSEKNQKMYPFDAAQ